MLHEKKTFRAFLSRRREKKKLQLRMVTLIDVVFLLLIFFLLTANFRAKEGFLPADLPREVRTAVISEVEPLPLRLESQSDGSCQIRIGRDQLLTVAAKDEKGGFAELQTRLNAVLETQRRRRTDPIRLMPTAKTSWDHVVRTYDVLWQLNLNNIIFSLAP